MMTCVIKKVLGSFIMLTNYTGDSYKINVTHYIKDYVQNMARNFNN